jgi:hypothetical protein
VIIPLLSNGAGHTATSAQSQIGCVPNFLGEREWTALLCVFGPLLLTSFENKATFFFAQSWEVLEAEISYAGALCLLVVFSETVW